MSVLLASVTLCASGKTPAETRAQVAAFLQQIASASDVHFTAVKNLIQNIPSNLQFASDFANLLSPPSSLTTFSHQQTSQFNTTSIPKSLFISDFSLFWTTLGKRTRTALLVVFEKERGPSEDADGYMDVGRKGKCSVVKK